MNTNEQRTEYDVGAIFRRWGPEYSRTHAMHGRQRRVMSSIAACRTAALGGHLERCDTCGFERPAYNSCRDRHCPTCQGVRLRKWLSARLGELLPVEYFHTVFTLPDTFNVLVPRNERVLYGLLFRAASEALRTLARRHWDAEPGVIAVLHTWGQGLWLHPHLHCIVTGGGLADDRQRWQYTARPGFLFDVAELSGEFRRRFCRLLRRARLTFAGDAARFSDPAVFKQFIDGEQSRPWVVYCKPPVAGAAKVLEYISRYTHRVALSNRRILEVTDEGTVTIDWKDYRDTASDGTPRHKRLELSAIEFIGRFLRHVLPRGFRKIRFYGIFAGRDKERKLAICRELLDAQLVDIDKLLADLHCWQSDDRCPRCEVGTMRLTTVKLLRERAPPVVRPLSRRTNHAAA
jgi:hypothetical protein